MKFTVLPGDRLTPQHLARWEEIHHTNAALSSAYFHPAFTQGVAAIRGDVEVCVIERDGTAVGFFPFQRGRWGTGSPVGGIMSDYHGPITAPDVEVNPRDLLRGCGLSVWGFDHLLAQQPSFDPYITHRAGSPVMDLSSGFDAYVQRRRTQGSQQISTIQRKARKAEREVGPIRYETHVTEPAIFDRLVEWKRAQYRETGVADVLGVKWTVALLHRIWMTQTPGFAGVMSVLYIADQPVAAHLGMRSKTAWHWWFPAYGKELSAYSPGLILLLRMAEAAPAMGLSRIDLGKGDANYKTSMMTHEEMLGEGRVEIPSLATATRHVWHTTESWVRRSPLRHVAGLARPIVRNLRRRASLR